MPAVQNATQAAICVREHLIKTNGPFGVVMLQIDSVEQTIYKEKPAWKVICSYYTNLSITERVKKSVYVNAEDSSILGENGAE